jgi:hypothetical protein
MLRRLRKDQSVAITYFENHLLVMGHGKVGFLQRREAEFDDVRPGWEKAFNGGRAALQGIDAFLRVDTTYLVAFARHPERYPDA